MHHKIAFVRGFAGITDKTEGGPFLLEAQQGDTISGNVSRQELARLVVTALSTPEATGTCQNLLYILMFFLLTIRYYLHSSKYFVEQHEQPFYMSH